MTHRVIVAAIGAVLCTATALAAQAGSQTNSTTTTTGPSAWVYLSSRVGTSNTYVVHAFTAGANGKLTPIAGSPFSADLAGLAVNGVYLFGTSAAGTYIEAYKIESNGSIHYSAETNAEGPNGCNTGPGPIVLDHTGGFLYDAYYDGDSTCGNSTEQAWKIVKSNGSLSYLDSAGSDDGLTDTPSFTANDAYAYTAGCYRAGPEVYAFRRNSNGSLTQMPAQPLPKAASGEFYCPLAAETDATDHVIVPVQPYDDYADPLTPDRLAVYTVHSDGSLTTTSTYSNMPKLSGDFYAMRVSPSGKLLAVSTSKGLKVYHLNGTVISPYTGYMSSVGFGQLAWDKDNHLYAASYNSNRLAVFTVTATSWKWDASYTINQPGALVVQWLPLPWQ